MAKANKIIDWQHAEKFVNSAFGGYGVPDKDAQICTDILLEANRRGIESHGLNRLKAIYLDRIKAGVQSPVTTPETVRETFTTAVIDGHNGMGQVISVRAMKLAIEKAQKYGLGMVAVRNSNHYGIAGYYAMQAAKAGCIGITGTNARPSVAPTFGVEGMFGTNPLAFGMPTDEDFPFVFDSATTIIQRGKIEYYAKIGKKVPYGTVIGRDGRVMTEPQEILPALTSGQAALVTLGGVGEELGGYKGYGYATVVEILSAALQQGNFLHLLSGLQEGEKCPLGIGHFFLAINIEAFTELGKFAKLTGDILRQLRSSEKAAGQERIYTAGEKEYLFWQEKKDSGIAMPRSTCEEFTDICRELHLDDFLHFFADES